MDTLSSQLRVLRALLIGAMLFVCTLAGFLLVRYFTDRGTPAIEPRPVVDRGELLGEEKETIRLFRRTAPSVVFITTLGTRYDLRMRPVEIPAGTGSGFIWDDSGSIVTNFHVIQRASGAKVTLGNHETYDASLVGVAPEFDLAVLKINAPKDKLPPIQVGRSEDLQVGQKVLAIGNPYGLDQTLTTGIVSATGRTIQGVAGPLEDVIQTDAAINPGNSGGPLMDSSGLLIGVNTAIFSQSGASAGIGFAVPVDTVNRIVPQLINNGRIVRPQIGVNLDDRISQSLTRQMGVGGVMVMGVQPGSPAEEAGLRGVQRAANGRLIPGDVIQQIDGRPIRNSQSFFAALGRRNVGDEITIQIFREGKILDVKARLDAETKSRL